MSACLPERSRQALLFFAYQHPQRLDRAQADVVRALKTATHALKLFGILTAQIEGNFGFGLRCICHESKVAHIADCVKENNVVTGIDITKNREYGSDCWGRAWWTSTECH